MRVIEESGMGHVMVFLGGIIPERDHEKMFSQGVRAIFGQALGPKKYLLFWKSLTLE